MFSTVTQVFWRQSWTAETLTHLRHALRSLGIRLDELPSQHLDLVVGTVGGVPLAECAFVAPAGREWSGLHLPPDTPYGEGLARALVQLTGQPALCLSEYDQVAWGFSLHSTDAPVQTFVNLPLMLDRVPPSPQVDPFQLARVLAVPRERVMPYLQPQSPDQVSQARAFPDDRFNLGDPWVRVDFLRAVGLVFPIPADCPEGRFSRFVLEASPPTDGPQGSGDWSALRWS